MDELTTNALAGHHYVAAAKAAERGDDPIPHLRAATAADPHFAVGAVDLAALTGMPLPCVPRPDTRWEREHLEIARLLVEGRRTRADGLLREHVADGADDPLLVLILLTH